ncbi:MULTISPECIES: hypothetical protein [Clostridia]|uniref:hypothetical protein n=1 Tax=Clostridia TaxID=186801 RepID=UPI000EA18FC3|nr:MULTISPECIES: hypothetical protein [Clostridia]NBJ68715.1 hypothetical protein [Roseburia sp. 1XD42-34]RKI80612.1 hypothetical protein D7V87_03515 [Clostridium sp. 1xD42-85]
MIWFYRFLATLGLLIFKVLYVGLIVSAVIGLGASILCTIGITQIEMTLTPNIPVPRYLRIPIMCAFVAVLLIIAKYVKRIINFLLNPFQS